MSSITLLVYHYVTTFDAECTHFWGKRRKFGLGWSLFLANRYLPLVTYMIEAPWWAYNRDPARCTATFATEFVLEYSQYALWGSIACLRVHALMHNRLLTLLVLLFALAPFACNIALLTYLHLEIRPVDSGCFLDDRRLPFGLYQIYLVIFYSAWVLSELLVVGVTLFATSHRKGLEGALGVGQLSLSEVLFRDGIIYFGAIALLNIVPLVVDLLEIVRPRGEVSDYSNSLLSFITPLISILLTQFYFDLQETADLPVWEGADAHAAHPEWTSPSPSPDQSSTGMQTDLRFATYVSQDRSRDHSESSTSSGARRRSVLSIEGSQTSD